jgi:betaine-aldehyde dehydrogenase
VYPIFIKKLLKRTRQNIVVGEPMDPATNFGALISLKHFHLVLDYINVGIKEGATLLHGGTSLQPKNSPEGYFVASTFFADCTDEMTICREEIFSPVMSVLTFNDEDEVVDRANATEFGLAAGAFTQDITRGHRVIHQMEAGICWINSFGASPAQMPVGGYKQSGVGRENGLVTLNHYTQIKAVYVGLEKLDSPF